MTHTGSDRLVETARFRAAFRQVPAPVAIILVPGGPAGVTGLTCTSATSLSGEPPMAMVGIDQKTGLAALAEQAGRFSINYLAADRATWAQAFAARGRHLDELAAAVIAGHTTVPTLATGTTAVLECRTTTVHPGGDHVILCGEVLHTRAQTDAPPLLYLGGRYGSFQPTPH
ncbi:flavin reductase family protein [Verrucosispora sp. FIM060022]|uniref:flavin reductase family protein n=1 Tax=Verrucosispora sp. FIM060022 TaxID=1479020 RepID=UPI000F88DA82|nr:flavin reductase family protein [Verrucosispora sp. FIM060022]RUL90554.1 flavin reductase [Verrucosispora sp. FIM060022]